MRLLPWLLFCSCASAAFAQSHNVTRRESGNDGGRRVVCYYTNWSVYRPGTAKFSPQNINPYLCTHLIYAFGGLTRENGLRPYDKYQDIEQGGYAKFTGLKTYNKNLKTMVAIGGWNEGSTRFSPLVADEERRAELVHNVVRFLRQNHFDGLDLDWEYPAFRDGGKARDRQNYALLVQELRQEFDRESSKTGRPRLLLTMAVPAGIEYIDKGYDIPKLNRYLDFMNILSYDYHSAFEPAVNHHSPLYPLEEDSEYNFDAQLSIDYTISHYLKLGADRDKLVLGIPTYGRSYTLFNPLATEIGSPADGPGEQGDATREKGYLAYYEICESVKSDSGWKVEHPNPGAMGPYAYKGNQWVGYDDIDIVKLKSRYVSENGLGGIMFWSIDNDDFRGKCHGRPYPLIEAGKEALLASSTSSNDVVTSSRGGSKTRNKKPSPTVTTNSGGRQSGERPHKRRPTSGRRNHDKVVRSTTTTTTTTTPKYNYPQTTPEPPTTPDPGSDFMCKDEGFFPHPRDCKKYFWCLDSGPSNLGIVAHQFTCPSGLFFNKAADSCDYARNVVCKKKSATASTTTKAPITSTAKSTTRLSSGTTPRTTTTTTTTTTPEPPPEEEYDDEDYEDEEDAEEDPQALKELLNLIKKLGGVEQLEKQLQHQGSDQNSNNGQVTTSGFSRTLYDKVLKRNNNNRAFSGGSATTPRYSSVYRNRPERPQNEGLEGLEEVAAVRREKPQYVTISRNRPAAAAPEEVDDDEEEESFPAATHEEANRGDHGKSQQVEYVTIRRARPSTEEPDTTTPKYITLTRSRRPPVEQEPEEEAEVTTEIRPVYVPSTERDPESRLHIVTPSRPVVRKLSRAEELPETTTIEPERKVSVGRPQYVDITSFRRQGNPTTSIPEEDLHYVEVNSLNRRRYAVHDNEVSNSEPTTLQDPSPTTVTQEETSTHKYIETTQVTEKHTETLPTTEETLTPKYTETLPNIETQTPKFTQPQPRRRGSTTPTTTQPPTTTLKTRKPNSRRRGTTSAPSTLFTPQQTTPPPVTTPLTPTSTRFTPTVTRVITSVTESGTTERQRIAINRVPYIAIAALRGETVYPGPVYKHKPTISTEQRILNPASNPTTPMTSVEHNTIPVTQKLERVMEVNMVVPVEVSTNDTTETTVTVDKISEVTRYKYVTVVDNTQTTNSSGEYTTESLSDVVSTLPTNSDFTATITEPSGSGTLEESSSTEITSTSVSPAVNRRRQGAVRRPGVDDFQRRRTRPPFTRSTTEATSSSTQSSFSLQRRGQRKRPRPYRPDNEVRSTSEPTEDSRKPFVPKRGQRKRPTRPSTLDVSENNILVTSEQPETSSRFVPRGRGNRRRTTTSKPVTETKSTPKRGRISTSTVEIKDLDELFTTNSPLSETTLTGNRLGLFPKKGSRNRYTTTVEPTVRTTFYEQETTEQTSGTDEANTETEATTLPSTSLNDIVRGTTFRPSSLRAYTQSTESSSDRVKIVKRRRRPVTRSSEVETQSTPQPSQNEVETSVTPFATDALLERENYDVTTGSVGGNVEKGGKQVNSLIDTAAVQKSSQPDSDPNDFETPSESIKLTTIDDTDLNTDTSGYASVNSIRTLGASVKSTSEEVLKEPVEPQTEGPAKKTFLKNFKTKLSTKEYFNASVEFTTDSAGSSTTEEPEKDRKESSIGDQKVRRLVKKKKTTQAQSEVVTTARTLRRPAGSFYNRTRQRGTTSTTSTTSSTTEAPTSTTASSLRRRPGARVVRRRKYGDTANSTRDNDATASQVAPSEAPTDKDASSGRVRKFSFPRRRQTTTPVPATTTPSHSDMQLLESSDHQATEVDEQQVDAFVTTKLPDLANSAVAAIHNLATSPPGTQTTSEPDVVKTTRITTTSEVPQTFPIVTTTPATASVFPRRGSTIYVSQPAAPASPLPPPRRGSTVYVEPVTASHVTSVAPPRRGSTVYIEPVTPTTPAPAPRRLPGSATLRPRPFSRTSSTSSRPKAKLPPIIDYEYYDDEDGFLDVAPVSGKVKIHSDGYIECLDRGNFPHPFSCKKFISCAKMENGELLGWEYTCPRQLSFDPIGGICNWSAGLGCKE